MSEIEINVKNLSPDLKQVKIKLQDKLMILKNNLTEENIQYVKNIFEKTLEKENQNQSISTFISIDENNKKNIVDLK